MTADQLAYKLKEIREEKGISLFELSKNINKEEDYMRKIEEGNILPTRNDLVQICAIFNMTLDELFNTENDKEVLIDQINEVLEKYDVEKLLKFYYLIKKQ